MVDTITSHDASSGGNVVNQSVFGYNDASLLTKEYQEHSGAKDGSTPYVGYNYDETASSGDYTKGLRPTSVRYPNGRLVHTTYGATDSTADAMSRVAAINADSGGSPGGSLADYEYLGAGAITEVDYVEPDLRYDLAHGAGDDPYDGLDRFGRVVDLLWYDYGSSTDAVRIQHGYDRAGSRLYREDPVASAAAVHLDELYGYDAANRLTAFDRGNLNGAQDALVSATKTFAQAWSLDPTGNWSGFQQDDDGDSTWDLDQSRTSNKVNELTNITETAGPSWVTPAYNRVGNMATIPQAADPTQSYTATYDPWNRLVKIADGGTTVAEYAYDAAKRRTIKKTYTGGVLDETRHYYYNDPSRWQVLEERVDASTSADRHFLWGLRYIDDLILRDRDTSDPKNGALNERLYALQDPNWNLVALSDTTGAIQERYAYSAYGTPRVLTPAFLTRASSSYAWELFYAGYRFDGETRMYQVRHRVLHPGLGWVQRDPIGYTSSLNLGLYVINSPLAMVDPFGRQQQSPNTEPFMPQIRIEPTPDPIDLRKLINSGNQEHVNRLMEQEVFKRFDTRRFEGPAGRNAWTFGRSVGGGHQLGLIKHTVLGYSNFIMGYHVEAEMKTVGGKRCCDLSKSYFVFMAFSAVLNDETNTARLADHVKVAPGTYLPLPWASTTSSFDRIAAHEKWHTDGTISDPAFAKLQKDAAEYRTKLAGFKGYRGQALEDADEAADRLRALISIGPHKALCEELAEKAFKEEFFDQKEYIMYQGAWHGRSYADGGTVFTEWNNEPYRR